MKILVACEYSGIIRDEFIKKGHDAISCDLLPTESPGPHYQGDVLDIINNGWDMMIAHPPCTYLTVTGNKWMKPEFKKRFPTRVEDRAKAVKFFMELVEVNIPKICIENPIGIMSTIYRKPNQIIHPYYFGDEAQKSTCLWLKNLPLLQHSEISDWFTKKTHVSHGEIHICKSGKKMPKWYAYATKDEAQKLRSKTFPGIAAAIAEQWG